MRCQQCGYANPQEHKFCGMCGARLESSARAVSIDDDDPLELENSVAVSGKRLGSAQIARKEERREASGNLRSRNLRPGQRTGPSSLSLEDFPPESMHREAIEEVQRRKHADQQEGISGPSFLGLGREESDSGFVYDNPRDDGFVYDTPGEAPEYLLTEVSRGVSWRAWALFLLLLIAAGLGYIQWRASRNEGPDIAAILSGNGAAVGPGGPNMNGNTKAPAPKPDTPAADSSKSDGQQANAGDSDSSDSKTAEDTTRSSEAAKESSDSKTANAKTADNNKTNANASTVNASAATSTKKVSAKDTDEEDSASKSDSDEPDAKVSKSSHAKSAPVEDQAPQPKPLGEKDPLILQAEKYIQGHGVRKNCSTGMNLLRQAVSEGNPAADVKMGALYWSGTCVTQSKVAAYEWFSRAHSLEPNNRWVERSRNSLWASMSPSEKHRAGY